MTVVWPDDFRAVPRTEGRRMVVRIAWRSAELLPLSSRGEQNVPSTAYEAIVLFDRAYFSRLVDESNWATNELAKGDVFAERIDWNTLAGEERVGLLMLVEEHSVQVSIQYETI